MNLLPVCWSTDCGCTPSRFLSSKAALYFENEEIAVTSAALRKKQKCSLNRGQIPRGGQQAITVGIRYYDMKCGVHKGIWVLMVHRTAIGYEHDLRHFYDRLRSPLPDPQTRQNRRSADFFMSCWRQRSFTTCPQRDTGGVCTALAAAAGRAEPQNKSRCGKKQSAGQGLSKDTTNESDIFRFLRAWSMTNAQKKNKAKKIFGQNVQKREHFLSKRREKNHISFHEIGISFNYFLRCGAPR